MNCREAQHHLSAERDGALVDDQRAALVQHVDGCRACQNFRAALDQSAAAWRVTMSVTNVPDSDLEWQELHRRIRGGASTRAAGVSDASRAARQRKSLLWF